MPSAFAVRRSLSTARGSAVGQRPQQADLRFQHQLGRRLPGHQRDLRVPALDRERGPKGERIAVGSGGDLLLRDPEIDSTPSPLTFLPEQPDLAQQLERLGGAAVVERALDAGVVELLATAYERASKVDVDALAARVDLHRPDERRARLTGKEAARALGEGRGVEPGVLVRGVERLAAVVSLGVHRPARLDERGDVGDRIADAVAAAVTLEVERLVEVHRLGRVDGDERDRGLVGLRQARRAARLLGVGQDGLGKLQRDVEVLAQLGERRRDRGGVGRGDADTAVRHNAGG